MTQHFDQSIFHIRAFQVAGKVGDKEEAAVFAGILESLPPEEGKRTVLEFLIEPALRPSSIALP